LNIPLYDYLAVFLSLKMALIEAADKNIGQSISDLV